MNAVKIKSGIKKGGGHDLGTMREENVREGKSFNFVYCYETNDLFCSRDRKRTRRNDGHVENLVGSEGAGQVASGDERRKEKDRIKDKNKDRRERRERYKDK